MNRRTFHLLALSLALVGCGRSNPIDSKAVRIEVPEKKVLTIKGSDLLVPLTQRWTDQFAHESPGISFKVGTGGLAAGIAGLLDGTTDICLSTRILTDAEKAEIEAKRGVPTVATKIALDALAVFVNDKNPLKEISIPDLQRIYSGEITNWKDLGGPNHPIVPYGHESTYGTHLYFKNHVLKDKEYMPGTRLVGGTPGILSALRNDPYGIGYGVVTFADGVRVLSVRRQPTSPAVVPSFDSAQRGTYPITRYHYFYTAGAPDGEKKRFIDWVVSVEGQKLVGDAGFFPLPNPTEHGMAAR